MHKNSSWHYSIVSLIFIGTCIIHPYIHAMETTALDKESSNRKYLSVSEKAINWWQKHKYLLDYNDGNFCCNYKRKRCGNFEDNLDKISRHFYSIHIPPDYRDYISKEYLVKYISSLKPNNNSSRNEMIKLEELINLDNTLSKNIGVQLHREDTHTTPFTIFCYTQYHGHYTTLEGAIIHLQKYHATKLGLPDKKTLETALNRLLTRIKESQVKKIRCMICKKRFRQNIAKYQHPSKCWTKSRSEPIK